MQNNTDENTEEVNNGNVNTTIQASTSKVSNLRAETHNTIHAINDAVFKMKERSKHLDELDYQSDLLLSSSQEYRMSSARLRKKYWWANIRMKLIILAVIIVIIIGLYLKFKP